MINNVVIKNFGNLTNVKWQNLGKINLIIGENSSGKSFLLKALYCSMRTIEEYKRGDDRRSESEILLEKLYWTFQTEKIGDLVSKTRLSLANDKAKEQKGKSATVEPVLLGITKASL